MWTIISNALVIIGCLLFVLVDYHIIKQNKLLSGQNAKLKAQYNQNVKEYDELVEQNVMLRSNFEKLIHTLKRIGNDEKEATK